MTQRSIATLHIGRHRADLVATIAAGVAVAVAVRWRGGRPKLSRIDAVRYRQVLTATAASLGVAGLIADRAKVLPAKDRGAIVAEHTEFDSILFALGLYRHKIQCKNSILPQHLVSERCSKNWSMFERRGKKTTISTCLPHAAPVSAHNQTRRCAAQQRPNPPWRWQYPSWS